MAELSESANVSHIHNVGDVGISCNRPGNTYEDITIRRLHIHDTGTGGGPGECMYLGCNNNDCQMWDSLIEFNWCHDTLAGSQGDGIELKTGSYNSVIRHNVVHDVKYPGITVYGTVDNKPANIVEGNAVWNVVDNGIQTVGDVIVRNNIVMSVGASGIAAKPSQGEIVENLEVVYNTVVGAGDACLRGNELPMGSNNVFANNALYCGATSAIKFPQGPGDAAVANNAVVGALNGQDMGTLDGIDPATAFLDADNMELYPSAQGPLVDAGSSDHSAAEDFNCLARDNGEPEIGAYDNAASPDANPGWVVQEGFKECADDGGEITGTTGDPTSGGETTGDSGDTDGGETTSTTDGPDTGEETTSSSTTGDEPCFSSGCDPTSDPSTTAGDESAGATGTDTEADADGDEGCGCAQSGADSSAPGWQLLMLLLGAGLLRRRGCAELS